MVATWMMHVSVLVLVLTLARFGSGNALRPPTGKELLQEHNRRSCITRMRQEYISSVQPLIRPRQPVVLLDIATHSNLGDNFIVLGEQMFLATVGATVTHICDVCILDRVAAVVGNGTILLHGGGNFGDLWRKFSLFRNEVTKRFRDNAIVFLPQDVFYQNETKALQDARIYAAHQHLHMLARNQASMEVLDKYFPNSPHTLCPDAAFMIGPIVPNSEPKYDIIFLIRGDKEAAGPAQQLPAALQQLQELNVSFATRSWEMWRDHMPLLMREARLPMERLPLYRIQAGNSMLSEGRVVITDRLHGMILSVLIGRPAVIMDNSYGKVSGYRKSHFTPDPNCAEENLQSFLVPDMPAALTKALDILRTVQ